MRIFVYEYASAQPKRAALPDSIRAEGRAMLNGLIEDFSALRGVEVAAMPNCTPEEEQDRFLGSAGRADWCLVVAPEFDGILETRCRWGLEAGSNLLGPSLSAIRTAGDKWETFKRLRNYGVPTPDTVVANGNPPAWDLPWVCKPRWGAGSLNMQLVLQRAAVPNIEGLLQHFHAGVPASVAFLVGPKQTVALKPARQLISQDGSFRYLGGRLPLAEDLSQRAVSLARRAVEAIPGVLGYVGVDLILGREADDDVVIEINPRITTSYVGLRVFALSNIAEAMLLLAQGKELEPLRWQENRPIAWSVAPQVLPRPRCNPVSVHRSRVRQVLADAP